MIAGKDPVIGRALDLLVPDLEVDPDSLLPAARTGAARLRATRRRRQTAVGLAFAVLLLFAGAAVAAHKLDLFSYLHTNDRNRATFSVSPSGRYRGPAAPALACPDARNGTFVCHVTSPHAAGGRTYELGMRLNRIPLLTRQSMLALIAHMHTKFAHTEKMLMRADLAKSGDDFIRALATLARIETVGVGRSNGLSGTERVPPTGIPAWLACRAVTRAAFRCQPLAALDGVASGTPLYYLKPGSDWRTVSASLPAHPNAFWRQLVRLLGRKPTAAERSVVFDFSVLGFTWNHSNLPLMGECGRCAALIAPQSLGVRARVVRDSGTELPLPRGPLPGGLTRAHTGLFLVVYDVLRPKGDRAARHALYVYVHCSGIRLGIRVHERFLSFCQDVWIAMKP